MCHVRSLSGQYLLQFAKPCVHAIQVVRLWGVRYQASNTDLGPRVPVGCAAGVLCKHDRDRLNATPPSPSLHTRSGAALLAPLPQAQTVTCAKHGEIVGPENTRRAFQPQLLTEA